MNTELSKFGHISNPTYMHCMTYMHYMHCMPYIIFNVSFHDLAANPLTCSLKTSGSVGAIAERQLLVVEVVQEVQVQVVAVVVVVAVEVVQVGELVEVSVVVRVELVIGR